MRKVFGYVRVSTTMQSEDGCSLSNQSQRIAAWCKERGYHLEHIFEDAGFSGSKMSNREGLRQALEAVKAAKGILAVHSLSRLSRSIVDASQIAQDLQRKGAAIASISENVDLSTASGELYFNLLLCFAQGERATLRERVSSAIGHLKAQGRRVGKVPYGFDLAADGERLIENKVEEAVIGEMKKMSRKGLSLRAIAKTLTQRGIHGKEGRGWHPESVRGILRRTNLKEAA